MLFVAEYEFGWEVLEAVIAKRLDWDEVQPDGFRFVGEYIWQDGEPPFRGVAIIDADSVEALNSFALHYGPTLRLRFHPASDVATGIKMVQPDTRSALAGKRKRTRRSAPSRPG